MHPTRGVWTTERQTRDALRRLEAEIVGVTRTRLLDRRDWARNVPDKAGVYVVWDEALGVPVYVGQTSSLAHRMRDIARWENHTCRRKLAEILKISRCDEMALSAALAKRYSISYLALSFGRIELEEYLRVRWRELVINSPATRMARVYAWVHQALPPHCQERLRSPGPKTRSPNVRR